MRSLAREYWPVGLIVALIAGAFVLSLPGCATDPRHRVLQYRDQFTTARDALSTLYESGQVSPEVYLRLRATDRAALGTLDEIDAALAAGRPVASASWDILAVWLAELRAVVGPPRPATQRAGIDPATALMFAGLLIDAVRRMQRAGRTELSESDIADILADEQASIVRAELNEADARRRSGTDQ